MILAILNFHVIQMPTIKFWLNPTYHSRANEFWWFSNGRPGNHLGYWNRAILENLNLYVSSDASYQVSAQSNSRFGRRCRLKNIKMTAVARFLDIGTKRFYQFWISMSPPIPSTEFRLNPTYRLKSEVIWRFLRWLPWWPSLISERNLFSSSESSCRPNATN